MPVSSRYADKEVQRDAKMVSYKVVDKGTKPYVEVDIAGEKKVPARMHLFCAQLLTCMMHLAWPFLRCYLHSCPCQELAWPFSIAA